jgi:hypothetical protein
MPGGVWTTGDINNPETRPGAYFNLIAQAIALIGEGEAGTVGLIGRADWGPVDEWVEVTSEAELVSNFGVGLSIPKLGKQAVRGGAGALRVLRIAGSSVATAELVLDDAVPDPALTVSALYPGARGNTFSVSVAANPVAGVDLKVFEGATLLETFTSPDGHNDSFAELIHGVSRFIDAVVTGTANRVVAAVASTPLAGGDSGATVVAGDYTTAQAQVLGEDIDVLVQDDEDDDAIQDSLAAFAEDARLQGSRFITVIGSAAGDTLNGSITRATSFDNEGIVYVFPGFTDTEGVIYTGQEAAARVAGLIAAAGITKSVTFSPIPDGADVELRLTNSQVSQALGAGILPLVFDGTSVAVEKGINTLSTITEDKPLAFTRIRTVMTLDAVQDGLEQGLKGLIGQVNNDDDGRATVLGAAQAFLDQLISARALKPGGFVELDPEFEQEADNVFLRVAVQPLDSIEKIFVTVYVSA